MLAKHFNNRVNEDRVWVKFVHSALICSLDRTMTFPVSSLGDIGAKMSRVGGWIADIR